MGKKRTSLGTQLHILLIILLVLFALSAVYYLAYIPTLPEDAYPSEIKGILTAVYFIFLGGSAVACHRYLTAFDKNEPLKIRTLTKVLLIVLVLVSVLWMVFMGLLKTPYIAQYEAVNAMIPDFGKAIVNLLLPVVSFAIMVYELEKSAKGNISSFDKRLWLAVLAIQLCIFLPEFVRANKLFGRLAISMQAVLLILGASQTLIALWITNPEKFYIEDCPPEMPESCDNY